MAIHKKKFQDFMNPAAEEPSVKGNEYMAVVYCANCGHGAMDAVVRVVKSKGDDYDDETCPNCGLTGKFKLKV